MRLALERSCLQPADITAIWSGKCGLKAVDAAEDTAIERVFGDQAPKVEAPKLLLGEPMGAGGSLNAALALESWQDKRSGPAGPVLVNSGSLGGTHFSLVLAPYTAG